MHQTFKHFWDIISTKNNDNANILYPMQRKKKCKIRPVFAWFPEISLIIVALSCNSLVSLVFSKSLQCMIGQENSSKFVKPNSKYQLSLKYGRMRHFKAVQCNQHHFQVLGLFPSEWFLSKTSFACYCCFFSPKSWCKKLTKCLKLAKTSSLNCSKLAKTSSVNYLSSR